MKQKKCSSCKVDKSICKYYKSPRHYLGVHSLCKECKNKQGKAYVEKNKEKVSIYYREYRKRNPDKNKKARKKYYEKNKETTIADYTMRKNYGITMKEYKTMLEKQEGLCAICREKCPSKKRLSVDHSHGTGRIRGLLCDPCNNGVGRFRDSIKLLGRAIKYLSI